MFLGVNEGFCLLCLFMRMLWTLMLMCDVVVVVFVFVCLFTHLHYVCVRARVCVCVCVLPGVEVGNHATKSPRRIF